MLIIIRLNYHLKEFIDFLLKFRLYSTTSCSRDRFSFTVLVNFNARYLNFTLSFIAMSESILTTLDTILTSDFIVTVNRVDNTWFTLTIHKRGRFIWLLCLCFKGYLTRCAAI